MRVHQGFGHYGFFGFILERTCVNVTVNKANKLLGLVHRTVSWSNPGAFSTLYKSLVRPVLEYAPLVWNSFLPKDVLALEKVR